MTPAERAAAASRDLPRGWRVRSLDEAAFWFSGGTPSKGVRRYWDGAIPWVSPKDMKAFVLQDVEDHVSEEAAEHGTRVVPANTIFVVVRGMILAHTFPVSIAGRAMAFNQDVKGVVARPDVHPRFLGHWFVASSNELLSLATASTHGTKKIDLLDLLRFPVRLPPAGEQRRIAEILDAADEAIRASEAVIAKLRSAKNGLMTSLVSGEGTSDRTATLGALAMFVTSGSRGWARYYSESGAVFLRIGNLTREHINLRFDDLVHVRPPDGGEGARTRVLPGDLLISITADLGIIGVIPEGLGEGYVNQHIALLRLDPARINSRWAAYCLAGPTGATQFRRLNDMGAKAGLNLPTVSGLSVSVPSRAAQDNAVSVLDAADAQIRGEQASLAKLRLQKQGLMQDLLTGRVRVNA